MSRSRDASFPIVCVGGSAGGLDAYIRLLKSLPDDVGVAVVIVSHVRKVPTLLHEILPRYTKMPVELITEKLDVRKAVESGCVDFVLSPEGIAARISQFARHQA
jgi:chemotaxis response regulator CheB